MKTDEYSPKENTIYLNEKDKELLQFLGVEIRKNLQKLESFNNIFESASTIQLSVQEKLIALQVQGTPHNATGAGVKIDIACWRDPPGICEPGPCPEDLILA